MHRLFFSSLLLLTFGLFLGCGDADEGTIASDDELTQYLEENPDVATNAEEEEELMAADDDVEEL